MRQAQKAITIGLGGSTEKISKHLLELMKTRELDDGKTYPSFLYKILTIKRSEALDADEPGSDCIMFEDHGGGQEGLQAEIQGDRFQEKFDQLLEGAIRQVSDASDIARVKTARDIEVKEDIYFFLIVPPSVKFAHQNFFNILKRIHKFCRERRFPFQVRALLLLPELISGDPNRDTRSFEARTYASLMEIEHLMNHKSGPPWNDNFPLDNIWLIDRYNDDNEAVGSLNEVSISLAEALASMIVEGIIIGDQKGADLKERGWFYSSFGFSQLVFPRSILREQMIDKTEQSFLSDYVLRDKGASPIDINEAVIKVKQFLKNDLEAGKFIERLQLDKDGKDLLPSFQYEVDPELPAEDFIEAVEEENAAHEDKVDKAKIDLLNRAQGIKGEVHRSIKDHINSLIDSEDGGIFHALAFYDKLLGRNEGSRYIDGDILEEEKSLKTVLDYYKGEMREVLGIDNMSEKKADLEEKLAEKEQELERYHEKEESTEEASKEEEGDKEGSENDTYPNSPDPEASEAGNGLESIRGKQDQLSEVITKLESKKEEAEESLSWYKDIWQDAESKKKLINQLSGNKKEEIEQIKTQLLENQNKLRSTSEELEELVERSRQYLPKWFWRYPLGAAGLLSSLWIGLFIAKTFSPLSLGNLLRNIGFSFLLLLVGYYVWEGGRYYKRFTAEIRRLHDRRNELQEKIKNLKSKLVDKSRAFHNWSLEVWSYDHLVTEVLMDLDSAISDDRATLHSFLDEGKGLHSKLAENEYQYPETLSRTSIVAEEDWQFFLPLLTSDELKEEAYRFFEETPLSSYAREGKEGLKSLQKDIYEFASDSFQSEIRVISIEELIFDHHEQLSQQASPENQLAPLFTVAPFLSIKDLAGTSNVKRNYSVGVEDADNSRIRGRELLKDLPISPDFFSHYDNSKIIAFCRTTNFPASSISQLSSLRESYDNFLDGGDKGEIHHPAFQDKELEKLEF